MKVLDKEGWLILTILIIVSILFFVTETYAKRSNSSSLKKPELVQQEYIELHLMK